MNKMDLFGETKEEKNLYATINDVKKDCVEQITQKVVDGKVFLEIDSKKFSMTGGLVDPILVFSMIREVYEIQNTVEDRSGLIHMAKNRALLKKVSSDNFEERHGPIGYHTIPSEEDGSLVLLQKSGTAEYFVQRGKMHEYVNVFFKLLEDKFSVTESALYAMIAKAKYYKEL